MQIQTYDQLFPHECNADTMKFSAYNAQTVSYYCSECGGKLVVRVAREEWPQYFEGESLTINEKVLSRAEAPPTEG
ncbi:MAG: hypothetical protein FJX76_19315 [Armatimonadetes bacterium]|nr:hypothetical protein [Armatimonadota bacterium]